MILVLYKFKNNNRYPTGIGAKGRNNFQYIVKSKVTRTPTKDFGDLDTNRLYYALTFIYKLLLSHPTPPKGA